MQFWGDDAAFEVPCPKCGISVEFFKDETSGRCTSCGLRFKNPKADFRCAQWCAYAEECLGFKPPSEASSDLGEGPLASRLIQAVKDEFSQQQSCIARALMVFRHAKQLACKEGGDLRLVLAAALLLDVGRHPTPDGKTPQTADAARVEKVLQEIGLDPDTIRGICRLIEICRAGIEPDTIEAKVVHDSDTLAGLASLSRDADRQKVQDIIDTELKTATGKERARAFFLA